MTTGQKIGLAAGLAVVFGIVFVFGLGVIVVRSYFNTLETSRAAIESLDADGFFVSRGCNPNLAVMTEASWNAIGHYQDTVMRSLAFICQRQSGGYTMRLVSAETGQTLAQIRNYDVEHAPRNPTSREDARPDGAARRR